MLPFTVTRHADVLAETIQLCLSNPSASISDCLRPTARDLDDIWSWNRELPPTYDFCMHEMISERAQATPDKEAICSWDGSMTYSQIDNYSTTVAHSLKAAGVQPHDVVPACFEKSRWTIVAVLAIMKAGATFALMDPTLPLARLQNMATQVGAKTMLSSRAQHSLAASILPSGTHLTIDGATFASSVSTLPPLPPVDPATLMYIIFTSGSTGTPKGVTISHRTYTSSAIPRARAVGYAPSWRVLDFASYAFDVSIDSMLLTTSHGGTLCIPSDADRLNDINGAMRAMAVNYAGITPSVARILEPEVIAALYGLGLGGEAASARDVNVWGRETRIIIGYGPCECTIGCTVNSDTATGRDYVSIGTGNGAAIWIADPNDHERLVPVGAVGELLVEGPIVGQGYLNDPAKTKEAFVEDPAWLVAGHVARGVRGRTGSRLYKTGDLGRYDPDGSGGIVFAGRKDTQVKLRGQRVELGEIESQLLARLPPETNVIAEVIVPQGAGGQATLVAFVAFNGAKGSVGVEVEAVQLDDEMRGVLAEADKELAKVVPRYMVPTAYIPVNHVPVLISGKTDRKRLRAFGQTVDLRQLDQGSSANATRELSELEKRLRQAWSQVLSIDADGIRPDDNLFALGGDSLAAMRLVSVCRADGLDLSVTSTFANPTLSAMAAVVRVSDTQARAELPPFSMISQDVESARLEAAAACGITDPAAIEDIYPSTPTQQALFTFALKSTKAYIAQRVARIPADMDLAAWKQAWETVVAANPILRSRLAQLQSPGLQQVVLNEKGITWRHAASLAQYLESDRQEKMELGLPLARYAIVNGPCDDESQRYMVWTIHHVLYDGWSEPLVLEQVRNALQQSQPTPHLPAQMRDFVAWVQSTDDAAMQDFWRRELAGAVGPQFPRLPSRDYLPTPGATVERQIALPETNSPFTLATLIRGAWALVAAQHAGSDDVVFGETLTGRDIALAGVESIVGPLIATVPVRIRVQRKKDTVEAYLAAVQDGVLARTPWQHMGFQNIRRVSPDAQLACETGTGLVIQPEPEYAGDDLGFEIGDVVREALHFNAYPVMLAFGIRKGGFRVCASFDTNLVEVAQMRRILAQLERVCLQLIGGPGERRLDQISCLPEAELDRIWKWNQTPPLAVDEALRCLRADANIRPGATYPRAVVPWVCDPRNSFMLSPIGCVGELWLEAAFLPGETVENPAWLVAGSSSCAGRTGRVQPTGDMVRLQEDGSLVFVRRKDNVFKIQGHAVDIADFDAPFSKHLPSSVHVAAAVWQQSSDKAQQSSEQELIVFVEQPALEEAGVELISASHDISQDGKTLQIRTSIPVSLAAALRKLDKSIQDSLASYMVPFAYVVVDKIPQSDHKTLNQLASAIPRAVLTQFHDGIRAAWTQTATQSALTPAEDVLRSAWAQILGIAPDLIDVDDNFFRLGGDSVLAMKLVSRLRSQGHSLSVADIFTHMRLGDAAKVMKSSAPTPAAKTQPTYKPFSLLGQQHVETFLSDVVRPQLADPSWTIQDAYPVTDSQALDVRGTINTPRTSVQYTLLYFEPGAVDAAQLSRACTELVAAHDILRTVFVQGEAGSNSFLQVVLASLDGVVTSQPADGDLEQHVAALCAADIESSEAFSLGTPFVQFTHVQDDADGRSCLILRLSHAQYDAVALPRLLTDLEALCTGTSPTDLPAFRPFSSYLAHTVGTASSAAQTAALSYWRTLLAHSTPPTILPGVAAQPGDRGLFRASPPLDISAKPQEITTANLLTAAWALVLARRLRVADVLFGGVTSGRIVEGLEDAEDVVGPCYQFAPVRVKFERGWRAGELLQFVQAQGGQSAAHDFVGWRRVAAECVPGWKGERAEEFFGSVVHHQDAAEDFDEMPFAQGTCKVGVEKPHGDAPVPFKAVSFVRGGEVHVGVVGSERDEAFVDGVLEELVGAVRELAGPEGEGGVLLGEEVFVDV
ncbi:Nonribosomal peptide synthetase 4 [Lasiodiplodia theobromae]|uniref:Nonribosomal peptide synthetase 4 n=1 Tax=Lasiodiplodia theobromae TaxID=45133 RepID=A0A5N5CY48_9PEZI|nr:Nonribosomal peptide synthetase 4 [Lasiodiplodia theobromae]